MDKVSLGIRSLWIRSHGKVVVGKLTWSQSRSDKTNVRPRQRAKQRKTVWLLSHIAGYVYILLSLLTDQSYQSRFPKSN